MASGAALPCLNEPCSASSRIRMQKVMRSRFDEPEVGWKQLDMMTNRCAVTLGHRRNGISLPDPASLNWLSSQDTKTCNGAPKPFR